MVEYWKVLVYIALRGVSDTDDVMRKFKVKRKTAYMILWRLKKKGYVFLLKGECAVEPEGVEKAREIMKKVMKEFKRAIVEEDKELAYLYWKDLNQILEAALSG